MTLRVLLYCRQSEERPGEDASTSLSLRSQEDRGRAWCAEHDAAVLGVITDHDVRGHDPARPGLRQLLDDAERLHADTVWVLSLSRFARDHILQELVWRDLQARGVTHLISDIESGTDDPFIRGIYGLLHAKSRTEMSAHLKGAFARRARDGGFPVGPTPTGYVRPHRIRVTRANGTSYDRATGEPVIDPDGAAFIRDLFDRYDRGESLHAITDELVRAGPGVRGGTWVPATVKKMLSSAIYVGDITHDGHVVAHNDAWQIVDRDVWERVQARLCRGPVVVRTGVPDHWLEGLVWHACGRRMYFQREARANGMSEIRHDMSEPRGTFGCRTSWESQRCGIARRMIGAKLLETVVRDCLSRDLSGILIPARAFEMAQERSGGAAVAKRRNAIERALQTATERWRRNHERFSAGKLPPAVMDAEDARLKEAKRSYALQIAALPQPPDKRRIENAYAALTRFAAVLPDATPDELHDAIDAIGRVTVGPDGIGLIYNPGLDDPIPEPTRVIVPHGGRGWRR